ncbi:MAG: hypothetical protein ACT4TC_23240, partial [Myxococcaceae bacterium]
MIGPDCNQVLDHLGQALPPALAAHVDGCPHCRAALESFDQMDQAPAPVLSSEALAELSQAVSRELQARPFAAPWWRAAAALSGFNLLLAAATVVVLGRGQLIQNRSPTWIVAPLAALLSAMTIGATLIALSPMRRSLLRTVLTTCGLAALVTLTTGSGFDPGGSLL